MIYSLVGAIWCRLVCELLSSLCTSVSWFRGLLPSPIQNATKKYQAGGNDKRLVHSVDGQLQSSHRCDCVCSWDHLSGRQVLTVPYPECVMLCANQVQADARNPNESDYH